MHDTGLGARRILTVSDRPHMDAEEVIEHHHWVWRNLISDFPVTMAEEFEL